MATTSVPAPIPGTTAWPVDETHGSEGLWDAARRALQAGDIAWAARWVRALIERGRRYGLPDGMPDVAQLRIFAGVLECFEPGA